MEPAGESVPTSPLLKGPCIEKLNRLTTKNHQGVIAFTSAVTYQRVEDLVPMLYEEGKNPLFVMLDGVTDVRNFGAIARTCECAGVDAVIIPTHDSVSVNADAMKTSAGALHTLPVCREPNLGNAIKYLKNCGFRVVARNVPTGSWFPFSPAPTLPQ